MTSKEGKVGVGNICQTCFQALHLLPIHLTKIIVHKNITHTHTGTHTYMLEYTEQPHIDNGIIHSL